MAVKREEVVEAYAMHERFHFRFDFNDAAMVMLLPRYQIHKHFAGDRSERTDRDCKQSMTNSPLNRSIDNTNTMALCCWPLSG